jgi:hypothetical protein
MVLTSSPAQSGPRVGQEWEPRRGGGPLAKPSPALHAQSAPRALHGALAGLRFFRRRCAPLRGMPSGSIGRRRHARPIDNGRQLPPVDGEPEGVGVIYEAVRRYELQRSDKRGVAGIEAAAPIVYCRIAYWARSRRASLPKAAPAMSSSKCAVCWWAANAASSRKTS